jgi:WD40 repeat protein
MPRSHRLSQFAVLFVFGLGICATLAIPSLYERYRWPRRFHPPGRTFWNTIQFRTTSLSHDGSTLFTSQVIYETGASEFGSTLWDIASRHIRHTWNRPGILSPNGKTVLIRQESGFLATDIETGQTLWQYPGFGKAQFSTDGRLLAVIKDGQIDVLDAAAGRRLSPLKGTSRFAWGATSHPNLPIVVICDDIGDVEVWNYATGKKLSSWLPHNKQRVRSVVFSPNGKSLATAGDDGAVYLWDANGIENDAPDHRPQTIAKLFVQVSAAESVVFTPDGKRLVVGGTDGTITLWNPTKGTKTELPGLWEEVNCVAVSANGTKLAASSNEKALVWQMPPEAR